MGSGYPGGIGGPEERGDRCPGGEGSLAHLTCCGVEGVGEAWEVGDDLPVGEEGGGAADGCGLPLMEGLVGDGLPDVGVRGGEAREGDGGQGDVGELELRTESSL